MFTHTHTPIYHILPIYPNKQILEYLIKVYLLVCTVQPTFCPFLTFFIPQNK
uniref:Uncharacterized protein n=1 Tax=Rhizophora mucronata TaxID=61149 RepID=A0A2P2NLK9_RHIMU